jgi:hypothetical protein
MKMGRICWIRVKVMGLWVNWIRLGSFLLHFTQKRIHLFSPPLSTDSSSKHIDLNIQIQHFWKTNSKITTKGLTWLPLAQTRGISCLLCRFLRPWIQQWRILLLSSWTVLDACCYRTRFIWSYSTWIRSFLLLLEITISLLCDLVVICVLKPACSDSRLCGLLLNQTACIWLC